MSPVKENMSGEHMSDFYNLHGKLEPVTFNNNTNHTLGKITPF